MARTPVTEPRGGQPISTTTRARLRAAIVAIAPAVLLVAFVYHPYIANLTDKAEVAAALASDTTRWGLSHLAVGVGSGLAVLAFLAVDLAPTTDPGDVVNDPSSGEMVPTIVELASSAGRLGG